MLILYVGYELDNPEIVGRFLTEQEIVCFFIHSKCLWIPTSSFAMGTESCFLRVVRDIK
jgi:hypothetical protein